MFMRGIVAPYYRMSTLGPNLDNGNSSKTYQIAKSVALLITNSIKLGGLIVAMYEVFTQPQPPAIAIALAAFMMAGAQVSEDAVINIFAKMFSSEEMHTQKKAESK